MTDLHKYINKSLLSLSKGWVYVKISFHNGNGGGGGGGGGAIFFIGLKIGRISLSSSCYNSQFIS